jgi:hypothetical protein
MATNGESRGAPRVVFSHVVEASMMGIDGTWRRSCVIEDISDTGAKLRVDGSLTGLSLKEFFLVLSSRGLAYRRCELIWVDGERLGALFLKSGKAEKTKPSLKPDR